MRKVKDITGCRYGRLIALERVYIDEKWRWKCQCDCGNICYVTLDCLGRTTHSCGCLRRDYAKERGLQPHSYFQTHKGKNHPRYNHDLTDDEREKIRYTDPEYREWINRVKQDANYTCDCCGKRGGELHSHHLYSYSKHKDLRTDIDNGVCLCVDCHRKFHSEFGYDNTEEQYKKFKKECKGEI